MSEYLVIKNNSRLEQLLFELSKNYLDLRLHSKEESSEEKIVSGCKSLCVALNVESRSGNPDSDRKQFLRISKKYGLPVHYQKNRIYMFNKDIKAIKAYYLLGLQSIAKYFGIHIKTLRKWLKKFPKLPIDRKKEVAFIPDLEHWYATLIFNRLKRGKSSNKLLKLESPITSGVFKVLVQLKVMGLSHPKELKQYYAFHPERKLHPVE